MLFYQTSTVFTLLVPLLVRGNPVPIPIPIPIPIPAPAPNNPAVTPITFDCNNAVRSSKTYLKLKLTSEKQQPENCQNMCWAALCRHAGGVALVDANNNVVVNPYSSLHYSKSGTNYVQDSKGKNREMDNRALSGASKANNDLLAQSGIGIPAGGKSTDEWPQASSQEGGLGATLRQVPGNEQSCKAPRHELYQSVSIPKAYNIQRKVAKPQNSKNLPMVLRIK